VSLISSWIADGLAPVGTLCTRNFDHRVLISVAVGEKRSMLLVRSCRYGLYAAAGVVWLVVSTILLLLLIRAKMKGGRSISADRTIIKLNTRKALFGKSFLSVSESILRLHVIMISLSIRGRDLGISQDGVGFFFLRDTVVNGFSLFSAAAVMRAAQVRSLVVGLCGRGAAGVPAR
jgi:energy-converting hydrogenase Eha subunit C